MLKTFKYRIFPTKKQQTILRGQLSECSWLWNQMLEQRKTSWEADKKSVSYHDQAVSIPKLKKHRESLSAVHSQVLQNVAVRLDLAFKAFFRRVKQGEEPGFPRFKSFRRYDSMTFPQYPGGCGIEEGKLHLSKVGFVQIVLHRKLEGKIKTCTVRRTSTGKWFATFVSEVFEKPLRTNKKSVGVDVGLASFATMSDGSKIANPRFFRKSEQSLARAQGKRDKLKKGSAERRRATVIVSKIHEKIANQRHDFCHQEARKLVKKYGVIAVEDLSINSMNKNRHLSKSIADAAWGKFVQCLSYKAEYAGRKLVLVNPAYTTQDCSTCGTRTKKQLSERVHRCPACRLNLDRDHNAALNILSLGLETLGVKTKEAPGFSRGE